MRILALILTAILAACGGGGSGGESAFSTVTFPPDGALTDSPTITVRGTTPGAAAVRVNGVAATSSDGFRSWSAMVPLARGANRLGVEAEEADGTVHEDESTVVREEILLGTADIELDPGNGRLLTVQRYTESRNAVTGVDLLTGRTSIVSGDGIGAGPSIGELGSIAVDPAGNRAVAWDDEQGALLEIDLATGDRTIVSDGARGTGDAFAGVRDLIIDPSRNRVIAVDGSRLITVDLATGDRNHWTDDLDGPRKIAIDPVNDRAIVLTNVGLSQVGLGTSADSEISDGSTGAGPAFSSPQDVVCNAAGDVAYVPQFRGGVLEVDLSTGDRSVRAGSGVPFTGERQIVIDAGRNRALVSDWNDGRDAILAVDLATGNRTLLFETARGSGPFFDDPRDVALDLRRGRAIVSDPGSDGDQILAVDLRTGDRSVIAPYPTGTPEGIVVEEARDRILIADIVDVIYAMDPVTGARTVLSDATTGAGPAIDNPKDLAVDAARDRVLVAASGGLFAVDLATGDRTALTGAGPSIDSLQDVEIDAANGRAIVLDADGEALVAVDLATGDRTTLSSAAVGTGPMFSTSEGFVLHGGRAFVVDDRTVWAVDLAAGDRTIVSDPDTGGGPVMGSTLRDIVFLPGGTALVLDDSSPNYLFAVDPESGDRAVFSK